MWRAVVWLRVACGAFCGTCGDGSGDILWRDVKFIVGGGEEDELSGDVSATFRNC